MVYNILRDSGELGWSATPVVCCNYGIFLHVRKIAFIFWFYLLAFRSPQSRICHRHFIHYFRRLIEPYHAIIIF